MSIEIDILNGDASWPIAEPLHQAELWLILGDAA
ncbi:hypothetical protein ACVIU7_008660 [Bradyrhizobium liaoningense]